MTLDLHVCLVVLLMGTPDELEIQRQLANKDTQARVQAVRRAAIQGKEAKPFIPALIQGLRSEKDPWVRVEFLRALAEIDSSSDAVIREIVSHFKDPALQVRVEAVNRAYSKIGINGLKHYVDFVNEKKNGTYRALGMYAIGFTYRKNKDAEISSSAVKCLEEHFNDSDRDARQTAIVAFQFLAGRKGTEESFAKITDAFVNFDGVRSPFIHVFKAYGERSLPFLKSALHHPDEDVRTITLSSLGYLGRVARPLLPEIEKAQSDPSPKVSFMAEFVHKEIRDATK